MARPQRNNVDYFPFLCKEGKAQYFIETKYGNDGYASWIKILRQLAVTNYHFLNLSDETEMMFLASKCKVDEEVLENILSDLGRLGEINRELWEENKVVYSDKFIETVQDAYLKRSNNPLSLEGLRSHLLSLGITNDRFTESKGIEKPQSKVKYSILNYSKEDYKSISSQERGDLWDEFEGGNLNKKTISSIIKDYGYDERFEYLYDLSFHKKEKAPAFVYWLELSLDVKRKVHLHWTEYVELKNDKYQEYFRTYLSNRGWESDLESLRLSNNGTGAKQQVTDWINE